MQPREKLLAGAVGALLAMIGLYYGYQQVVAWYDARYARIDSLKQEVATKEATIARGSRDQRKILAWEEQSLASDAELAKTTYQNWLSERADDVGFLGVNVELLRGMPKKNVYDKLSFKVRAEATLDQVVKFLYDFYRKDQLHQVRSIMLTPKAGGRLDVALSIEALALTTADPKKGLAEESDERLAAAVLDDFAKPIIDRNLFAAYAPPPPPQPVRQAPPAPPPFDAGRFAFVTAILEVGREPQVWVNLRTTGQLLKLAEGDEFTIGEQKATIAKIRVRDVEIEAADGSRMLVALGKSIRDGQPMATAQNVE